LHVVLCHQPLVRIGIDTCGGSADGRWETTEKLAAEFAVLQSALFRITVW